MRILYYKNLRENLLYNRFISKEFYFKSFEEHGFYEKKTLRNTTSATIKIIVCVSTNTTFEI